jgi:hypothetical protein
LSDNDKLKEGRDKVGDRWSGFALKSENPTLGSEWIVQILPTKKSTAETLECPQRQLGDCSDPTYKQAAPKPRNPPNGKLGDCSDPALHRERPRPYSSSMYLTPFTSLAWAYQLHYYLCFRTHRRRPLFTSKAAQLTEIVCEICARHDYHALEYQPRPDQFRCLLSLQPGKNYPQALVQVGIDQLWETSAYAGTCGELTRALIKAWLSTSE